MPEPKGSPVDYDRVVADNPPDPAHRDYTGKDQATLTPWLDALVRHDPEIHIEGVEQWLRQNKQTVLENGGVLPSTETQWGEARSGLYSLLLRSKYEHLLDKADEKALASKDRDTAPPPPRGLLEIFGSYFPARKKKGVLPEKEKSPIPSGTSPGLACTCFGKMHPDPDRPNSCGNTLG